VSVISGANSGTMETARNARDVCVGLGGGLVYRPRSRRVGLRVEAAKLWPVFDEDPIPPGDTFVPRLWTLRRRRRVWVVEGIFGSRHLNDEGARKAAYAALPKGQVDAVAAMNPPCRAVSTTTSSWRAGIQSGVRRSRAACGPGAKPGLYTRPGSVQRWSFRSSRRGSRRSSRCLPRSQRWSWSTFPRLPSQRPG
jgi:hypothetical protein